MSSSLTRREEVCSMCEAEPEDMLILTCRHNLCLDCATQLYNLNTKNDHILCEICLSSTPLDNDTIVCLRSLSAKAISQNVIPTHSQYKQSQLPQNQRTYYPPIPKSHYQPFKPQILSQIPQQPALPRCQKHNQPLTYYCLQCNIYTICSQCMLLQNHRYHKVVTLKKASLQIKETIQKVGREKMKLKTLLQKDRESLITRRQESQKQLQTNLFELKAVFDQVIKIVAKRYEQMKITMERDAARKLQIMDGAINEIQQKVNLIDQTIEFQNDLMKSCTGQEMSNTFQMFDYYSTQITNNRLNFEPSLPNFISEVYLQKILNKQKVFAEIQSFLNDLIIGTDEEDRSQDNINLISQIDNNMAMLDGPKERRGMSSMKKRTTQQDNVCLTNDLMPKKPISQNINIIQLGSLSNYGIRQKKESNITNSKKSTIQAIKRKARQNMKDRQLSHSRKLQLSRSIQNATDILNKIQQRTSKA